MTQNKGTLVATAVRYMLVRLDHELMQLVPSPPPGGLTRLVLSDPSLLSKTELTRRLCRADIEHRTPAGSYDFTSVHRDLSLSK